MNLAPSLYKVQAEQNVLSEQIREEDFSGAAVTSRLDCRIEQAHGDLDGALARYEEIHGIRRALAEELGTPQSRRDLSVSLNNVAGIEQARGDLDGALEKYEESLAIAQRFLEHDVTPETQNGSLWTAHLTASCVVGLSRLCEALAMLDGVSSTAAELELACDDDLNMLDTCAAFYETYANASAALGRANEAQRRSERGAAIRARITALKGGTAR